MRSRRCRPISGRRPGLPGRAQGHARLPGLV